MFVYFTKHLRLFITIWTIPLIFHVFIAQTYAKAALSERMAMGSLAAAICSLIILLLLHLVPKRYLWLYAMCWTIPFSFASSGYYNYFTENFPSIFMVGLLFGLAGIFLALVVSVINELVRSMLNRTK